MTDNAKKLQTQTQVHLARVGFITLQMEAMQAELNKLKTELAWLNDEFNRDVATPIKTAEQLDAPNHA